MSQLAAGSRTRANVVLCCGHESAGGAAMAGSASTTRVARPGRELVAEVGAALEDGRAPVCVVPMTLGRDPGLVADTARALRWINRDTGTGRVALAPPFGTPDHLVGWLRAAVRRLPLAVAGTAILVTAPAAGPFEDADLFRIVRLARQYGPHRWVEVAFAGGDPGVAEGVERCRLLGADRVATIPAWFGAGAPAEVPHAVDGGPLLTASAVDGVIDARVAAALARLRGADDGILARLGAEHGHGFAHSHADHADPHQHAHPHDQADPHHHAHPPEHALIDPRPEGSGDV